MIVFRLANPNTRQGGPNFSAEKGTPRKTPLGKSLYSSAVSIDLDRSYIQLDIALDYIKARSAPTAGVLPESGSSQVDTPSTFRRERSFR